MDGCDGNDLKKLCQAQGQLGDGFRIATGNLGVSDIVSTARAEIREHGVGAVFIDQFSHIRRPSGQSQLDAAYAISRALKKDLALMLDVPVYVLAQLNREADRGRPTLATLFGCDGLSQDADIIVSPYREDRSRPEGDLLCLKHRSGEVWEDIPFNFIGAEQRFKARERADVESDGGYSWDG